MSFSARAVLVVCYEYDFFVSHAVAPDLEPRLELGALYGAFRRHGFRVFWDLLQQARPDGVAPFLEKAVEESWGGLLILTRRAAQRGWVAVEQQSFLRERRRRRFPVGAVILEAECQAPEWVDQEFRVPTLWNADRVVSEVERWADELERMLDPGISRGPRYRTMLPGKSG